MAGQIKGMKLLTRIVARGQRTALLEVEKQLQDLVASVDGFYDLLGARNWIYHDNLNTEVVKEIIQKPADEAEQALIAYYRESDTLDFMVRHLRRFPPMRAREDLIRRAREDYEADRFDAATLLLITVMDGFVNDVETEQRRGLHARDDDEMVA
ncbi:MAG TPA: hypothetical protein VF081_09235 [Solirubrobacterales bacterium]